MLLELRALTGLLPSSIAAWFDNPQAEETARWHARAGHAPLLQGRSATGNQAFFRLRALPGWNAIRSAGRNVVRQVGAQAARPSAPGKRGGEAGIRTPDTGFASVTA